MTKIILLLVSSICLQTSFGQKKRDEQIGLSIPVIWNNTEIYNVYSGARADYISGNGVSYGVNFNYTRNVIKTFFLTVGIGYYNQNFGIHRPFSFSGDSITNLLYNTKKYSYRSLNWLAGVGYKYWLNKKSSLLGSIVFNGFYTYQQKYSPDGTCYSCFKKNQVERNGYSFGQSININVGTSRKISPKLTIEADAILPIYTRWRKDRIFIENENEFYHSKFSIGTNLSIKYNLHN